MSCRFRLLLFSDAHRDEPRFIAAEPAAFDARASRAVGREQSARYCSHAHASPRILIADAHAASHSMHYFPISRHICRRRL